MTKKKAMRADSLVVNACLTIPWADFTKALHACWEQSTALANWCARELDRRDVVRLPGMKKLPPMPKIPDTPKPDDWVGPKTKGNVLRDLYGLAAVTFRTDRGFWAGSLNSVASLTKRVKDKYTNDRPKVIWGGKQTSARYRYPYPFPVHPDCWNALIRDGKPVLRLKLPTLGWLELSLRGGPEFGRQLANFRRVASGEAKKSQLLITRQRTSASCHRRTAEAKEPGGGDRTHYRVMVKLITQQPAREAPGGRILTLCTDPAALWVAELDGRKAWVLNADHVKRALDWQAAHEVRRQRWAEDTKAERRCSSRKRKQFQVSRDRCCDKHSRRMKSWCQESASHLARFAARQRVGLVEYQDDENKSGLPGMPWHRLKTDLANALAGYGIALVCASEKGGEVPPLEEAIPLEGEEACLRAMEQSERAGRRLSAARSRSGSHPAVCRPSGTSPTSASPTPLTSSRATSGSGKRTPPSAASAKRGR